MGAHELVSLARRRLTFDEVTLSIGSSSSFLNTPPFRRSAVLVTNDRARQVESFSKNDKMHLGLEKKVVLLSGSSATVDASYDISNSY